uniref:Uncharacterized protein n=1 Tax=Chromera velia CCMP2878 TaxID=1169474 RepID=A0A0G4HAV1_9ALVE|eukprot:Cvel_25771.t1-p1 / transcript=Cvel_25771.t1 / gene=Cvel_25771 / organism=Chromera_velia_CCMP2878 / gene_product=Tenascin, putative / transcript_product=Tenascin, putative / location=Cvel_scaffold2969:4637-5878(-) / protein_length=414 / sequence_SO=supercontig / SO=protein_coding / is_pseudo=false
MCEHRRRRNDCKECGGKNICEHGRKRQDCIPCGGSNICEHGRKRYDCIPCGGKNICEHARIRRFCGVCRPKKAGPSPVEAQETKAAPNSKRKGGGRQQCEHGQRRDQCKECGGEGNCKHGQLRRSCVECVGESGCEHGRDRAFCGDCIVNKSAEGLVKKGRGGGRGGKTGKEGEAAEASSTTARDRRSGKRKREAEAQEEGQGVESVPACEGGGALGEILSGDLTGNRPEKCRRVPEPCTDDREHKAAASADDGRGECQKGKGSGGRRTARCEHNRQRYHCKECKGGGICLHGKDKRYCKECRPMRDSGKVSKVHKGETGAVTEMKGVRGGGAKTTQNSSVWVTVGVISEAEGGTEQPPQTEPPELQSPTLNRGDPPEPSWREPDPQSQPFHPLTNEEADGFEEDEIGLLEEME